MKYGRATTELLSHAAPLRYLASFCFTYRQHSIVGLRQAISQFWKRFASVIASVHLRKLLLCASWSGRWKFSR